MTLTAACHLEAETLDNGKLRDHSGIIFLITTVRYNTLLAGMLRLHEKIDVNSQHNPMTAAQQMTAIILILLLLVNCSTHILRLMQSSMRNLCGSGCVNENPRASQFMVRSELAG